MISKSMVSNYEKMKDSMAGKFLQKKSFKSFCWSMTVNISIFSLWEEDIV